MRIFLLISIISVILVGSTLLIFSESESLSQREHNVTEKNIIPELTSYEEAISIADDFLKEKVGDEFFAAHLRVMEVNERSDIPSTWVVLYEYNYNRYHVNLSVAINSGRIPKDDSRINLEFSNVVLEPQEILISQEEAKSIAQENGLEPPFTLFLSCEMEFHRICWRMVKENAEIGNLKGLLLDAESGIVLKTWVGGIGNSEVYLR